MSCLGVGVVQRFLEAMGEKAYSHWKGVNWGGTKETKESAFPYFMSLDTFQCLLVYSLWELE